MEQLAKRPIQKEELREQRSFNPLASTEMMRDDLTTFGEITSETIERVYDTELSLLVEGMDRAACTSFVLKRQGDELVYYKNGEWEPYTVMLLTGRTVAEAEAEADSRKQFLLDDAINDLYHGYKMQALKPGEQHVWNSPYRYDLEQKYGAEFMTSCGRFPNRKMGFLYRAACDEAGNVVLESQTVDNSDDEAFAAALDRAADDPRPDMHTLVGAYDQVLARKRGGNFHAGRTDIEYRENAWDQLREQRDLIEYFIQGIETIARGSLQGSALEEAAKRHTYGVWAAFKKRFDGGPVAKLELVNLPIVHYAMVAHEVRGAFKEFAAAGFAMVGCGGEIKIRRGEKDILDASPDDILDALFSPELERTSNGAADQFGPLSFQCTRGHWNTRSPGKLKSQCSEWGCSGSVGCGESSKKARASNEQAYTKIVSEQWARLVKTVLGEAPKPRKKEKVTEAPSRVLLAASNSSKK